MQTLSKILLALFGARPVFANVATGVHEGGITKTLEQDVATRHLLGKQGSTAGEVDLCAADDLPLGVITDSGEAGDPVNVALFSTSTATLRMVAGEAIQQGQPVYTADNGKVQNQPGVVGEYYLVGHALTTAAGDGELLEVLPTAPRHTKVIASFTGTAGTDIAALGAALSDGPDKVIVLV